MDRGFRGETQIPDLRHIPRPALTQEDVDFFNREGYVCDVVLRNAFRPEETKASQGRFNLRADFALPLKFGHPPI